jgi:hypothetical protein
VVQTLFKPSSLQYAPLVREHQTCFMVNMQLVDGTEALINYEPLNGTAHHKHKLSMYSMGGVTQFSQ